MIETPREYRATRTPATVLGLCLALLIAACSGGDGGPQPTADHVTAVVLPFLTLMPFHVAAEEGYFAEQNLDVEFVQLGRSREVMTALARGEVDVSGGLVTTTELALVARGAQIRMVSSLGRLAADHCAHAAFLTRREHLESGALQDRDRIRGLRFDVDLLSPYGYVTDELVRPFDLTVDDLDIVDLPPPAALAAIFDGAIDVTIMSEPWVSRTLESEDLVIWERAGEVVPDYVLTMLMYGPTMLDRPEVGERFAVAMLKAVRQFNRGKTPRNLEIVERATGLSAELVAAACWAQIRDDARIDPSGLRGYQEWNVAQGFLERVLSDDELFDHRFIDHANAVLDRSR